MTCRESAVFKRFYTDHFNMLMAGNNAWGALSRALHVRYGHRVEGGINYMTYNTRSRGMYAWLKVFE